MGRTSADYKRKIRAAAAKGGRNADHKSPLRKVLGVVEIERTFRQGGGTYYLDRELLECGHLHRTKEDWHGPTNAERRRCKPCAAGRPPDVDPNDYQ